MTQVRSFLLIRESSIHPTEPVPVVWPHVFFRHEDNPLPSLISPTTPETWFSVRSFDESRFLDLFIFESTQTKCNSTLSYVISPLFNQVNLSIITRDPGSGLIGFEPKPTISSFPILWSHIYTISVLSGLTFCSVSNVLLWYFYRQRRQNTPGSWLHSGFRVHPLLCLMFRYLPWQFLYSSTQTSVYMDSETAFTEKSPSSFERNLR